MAHEPLGFSASMIATGRELTLPLDLESNACASPSLDDPASYVEAVKKRLSLTHQQMVPPPAPAATNPYQEGSLIFALATPPERANKLAPRWKGPFVVRRVPNPPASRWLTLAAVTANRNSASRSAQPPPTAPARTNENSRPGHQLWRSARLTPRACTIKSAAPPPAPQSLSKTMARTYPLSLAFNQCLGSKEDPYSFSSVHLEDLHNGEAEYLVTVQQLVDAMPKTLDPASRFALLGQVTPTRHQRLRHSMRAALWWLLPSDGDFRRAPNGIHYYLARQGRRVVLRGGDVTQPLFESRMNWIYDPAPPTPRRATLDYSDTPVQPSETPVQSRDNHVNSRDPPVLTSGTQASAIDIRAFSGAPLALPHPKKSRRRRRRMNRRSTNENSAPRSAAPVTPDERWANRNSASQRATQHQSAATDPIQMMSTPVYEGQSIHSSHLTQPPVPAINRNSAFPFGLDRCEFPGLYKPAFTDPRQDLNTTPSRVNNSGSGFSSPSLLQSCTNPFFGRPARPQMTCPTREAGEAIRERLGIVYPLLPRAQRPDTRVAIEAALPEAAALGRQAQPPTVVDIGDTSLPQRSPSPRRRASRKPSRKRRRNRSAGVYRLPKRSPPHGHWCE